MILCSPLDDVKRREAAMKVIASLIDEHGRSGIYDLTGLTGGFHLKDRDLSLLETYTGPAIFEEKLQKLGKDHLGGEKVLAFNRTTTAILAVFLALVNSEDEVVHYLPKLPSHPSIPRIAKLLGATNREHDSMNDFRLSKKSSLVIITGSTMDHQVTSVEDMETIIQTSHSQGIPVMVDDASGARLRTILYGQPRATDMGADIVVTSMDKFIDGPRAGLMAGKANLIDLVKSEAHQFGLEAQPPIIAGIVRALENFSPGKIIDAAQRSEKLYYTMKNDFKHLEKTPTGISLPTHAVMEQIDDKKGISPREASTILAMILLRDYGILTIPAVGMPGVSDTIRLDLAANDAKRIEDQQIISAIQDSIIRLLEISGDEETCIEVLYGK